MRCTFDSSTTAPTYEHIYPSLDGMISATRQAVKEGRRYDMDPDGRDPNTWYGRPIESLDDAIDKAGEVWPAGLELLASMVKELTPLELPKPKCRKRRARWDVDSGDEVDMDRLRGGQEYWRTMRREEARGPSVLTVACNVGGISYLSADQLIWRGAAAVVLADLLEVAGYRVEFWAMRNGREVYQDGGDEFSAVCLKRADQPLDMATLVNGISAWLYRSIWFASYFVEKRSTPRDSLGRSEPLEGILPRIREVVGGGTLVVLDNVWDRDAAVALVKKVIDELNEEAR
jgi:hypothetical protein